MFFLFDYLKQSIKVGDIAGIILNVDDNHIEFFDCLLGQPQTLWDVYLKDGTSITFLSTWLD